MNKFDAVVLGALEIAQTLAQEKKHAELMPIHLLMGLIQNPQSFSSKAFKSSKKDIEKNINLIPTLKNAVEMSDLKTSTKLSEWITKASSRVIQAGRMEIGEADLLRFAPAYFPELTIDWEKAMQDSEESPEPSFLVNLNDLAEKGKLDPVIGRTKEIRAVMEILGRRSKNNPVLVGSAGVGKTAIVEGLADAIFKGNVPDVLKDKVVYSLDLGALMAGTKFRGEFEERIQTLLKFIKEKAGEAILFIDEIHQLVGAGKTDGAMDAANLLKPALARGDLHCIGATTNNEYQKYILGDSALDRRFRAVPVDEPSVEDAIEILMGVREKLEIHHGIKISDEAVYSAVLLSHQYITDKFLPDKAIDLIDEASSAMKLSAEAMPAKLVELEAEIRSKKIYAQMEKENQDLKTEIVELEKEFLEGKSKWETEILSVKKVSELKNQLERYKFDLEQKERAGDYEGASKLKYSLIPEIEKHIADCPQDFILQATNVAAVISRQTKIPVEKILKSQQENILELETFLQKRVFGQNESLHEIAQTLISSHAGLSDESRPLGSFLLKGPSGVGKTETAKGLAEFLFSSENNLIRIDLSEYSEKHSVAKLIGAPAGYVGYDEGGILTEAVRRKPYAVILFDEIEKAHPDFADILLQILDDGRLTDNKGRMINFKNTIIFITTNSKNIEQDFKPEVLGRLDAVLTYNKLDKSVMKELVRKQVEMLNQRLKSKKIKISLGHSLTEYIEEAGFDERYGARPLNAFFQKIVVRPLATKILADDVSQKDLLLDWKAGKMEIFPAH